MSNNRFWIIGFVPVCKMQPFLDLVMFMNLIECGKGIQPVVAGYISKAEGRESGKI